MLLDNRYSFILFIPFPCLFLKQPKRFSRNCIVKFYLLWYILKRGTHKDLGILNICINIFQRVIVEKCILSLYFNAYFLSKLIDVNKFLSLNQWMFLLVWKTSSGLKVLNLLVVKINNENTNRAKLSKNFSDKTIWIYVLEALENFAPSKQSFTSGRSKTSHCTT